MDSCSSVTWSVHPLLAISLEAIVVLIVRPAAWPLVPCSGGAFSSLDGRKLQVLLSFGAFLLWKWHNDPSTAPVNAPGCASNARLPPTF
jgi:hypothetical protein